MEDFLASYFAIEYSLTSKYSLFVGLKTTTQLDLDKVRTWAISLIDQLSFVNQVGFELRALWASEPQWTDYTSPTMQICPICTTRSAYTILYMRLLLWKLLWQLVDQEA